jgi:hypothetical protein
VIGNRVDGLPARVPDDLGERPHEWVLSSSGNAVSAMTANSAKRGTPWIAPVARPPRPRAAGMRTHRAWIGEKARE